MNVIVDVRGMNVNMRVSEDPIEGIFCALAPKALFNASERWGSAPQGSDCPQITKRSKHG